MPQPILVFIEVSNGAVKKLSLEALSEAKRQADKTQSEVIGLLVGHQVESLAQGLGAYGAGKVLVVDGKEFQAYTTAAYTKALNQAVEKVKPLAVFMSATPVGKDLSGSVGSALQTSAAQDCISVSYDNSFIVRRP